MEMLLASAENSLEALLSGPGDNGDDKDDRPDSGGSDGEIPDLDDIRGPDPSGP